MLEKLRAGMLAKAKVDNEASMQASNAELYQKQQQAEAQLYTQKTNAQVVEQAADAQLYKKRKEAEGILATGEAQATYIKSMLEAFGGNYNALHDYLMLDRGVYQQLGEINAGAIKGLQPKISVWTTGPSTDAAATGAAGAPIADLFKMLPPLYTTIKDQTGITPLPFLATLPQEQK